MIAMTPAARAVENGIADRYCQILNGRADYLASIRNWLASKPADSIP